MGRCNKANLTADQVVDMIVSRADSIRNSNFYLAFGVFCAALISCLPFIYRRIAIDNYVIFEGMPNDRIDEASFWSLCWR